MTEAEQTALRMRVEVLSQTIDHLLRQIDMLGGRLNDQRDAIDSLSARVDSIPAPGSVFTIAPAPESSHSLLTAIFGGAPV